jgi:hypothetical protein
MSLQQGLRLVHVHINNVKGLQIRNVPLGLLAFIRFVSLNPDDSVS